MSWFVKDKILTSMYFISPSHPAMKAKVIRLG